MLGVKAAGGTAIQTPPISTNIKLIRSNAGSRRWAGGAGNSRILRGRWATSVSHGPGVHGLTVTVRTYKNLIPAHAVRKRSVPRLFENILSRTGGVKRKQKDPNEKHEFENAAPAMREVSRGRRENAP